jgi:hypothetical protein
MANETPRGPVAIPNRRVVVNALVLAFSHSKLNKVVGTDAFRSVLDAEYRTLTADGVFNLGPVWELIESQPGFDPEQAGPPLCRFKSWEGLIGIPVALPPQLASLSAAEQSRLADSCTIPSRDLQRLLREERAGKEDEAAVGTSTSRERTAAADPRRGATTERSRVAASGDRAAPDGARAPDRARTPPPHIADTGRRRKIWLGGAILIAMLGFGIGGVALTRACGGPRLVDFSARDINAAGVPVSDGARIGQQVVATLSDEAWLRIGDDVRRSQMTEALRALDRQGIRSLVVRQRGGEVRAAAQYLGDGRDISVTLR